MITFCHLVEIHYSTVPERGKNTQSTHQERIHESFLKTRRIIESLSFLHRTRLSVLNGDLQNRKNLGEKISCRLKALPALLAAKDLTHAPFFICISRFLAILTDLAGVSQSNRAFQWAARG